MHSEYNLHKISECNLLALIYWLSHEFFSSIVEINTDLYQHSATCDSRTHLICSEYEP